jgi:hypothetical protein
MYDPIAHFFTQKLEEGALETLKHATTHRHVGLAYMLRSRVFLDLQKAMMAPDWNVGMPAEAPGLDLKQWLMDYTEPLSRVWRNNGGPCEQALQFYGHPGLHQRTQLPDLDSREYNMNRFLDIMDKWNGPYVSILEEISERYVGLDYTLPLNTFLNLWKAIS